MRLFVDDFVEDGCHEAVKCDGLQYAKSILNHNKMLQCTHIILSYNMYSKACLFFPVPKPSYSPPFTFSLFFLF